MTTKKHTILLVEDEKPSLKALNDKLTREGFDIIEARNGKEGLEIALRQHPDVILIDIIMPVMDGIAMLKELRNDAWGKDVKVIVLTNLSSTEKVAEAVEQGTYEYLVKSDWKIADVATRVKQILFL